VVVNPETDSKRASAKHGIVFERYSGRAPKMPAPIHAAATRIIPPETESLSFCRLFIKNKIPAAVQTAIIGITNEGITKASPAYSAAAAGIKKLTAIIARIIKIILKYRNIFIR